MPTKKVKIKKIQSYPSFWFPLKVFTTLTIERSFLFSRFGVFEWNEENFDRNVLYWPTTRGDLYRGMSTIFLFFCFLFYFYGEKVKPQPKWKSVTRRKKSIWSHFKIGNVGGWSNLLLQLGEEKIEWTLT
jgi:hypothetical protein